MTRKRVGLAMGFAMGLVWVGCGDDAPGLGGQSGSTEDPHKVSGAEAQAIAEAISIDGADIVRKELPDPSDDPAAPAVRSLPARDIGIAMSRLDINFQAESREGGGALRGVYLKLEGSDFYWDIPKRALKQNAVTATDDVTVGFDLPDVSPGIEFCFTVCVYSTEDLVSQPQTTCITVPNLESSLKKDIDTICAGLKTCKIGPDSCVDELTREIAGVQAFADGCGSAVADTASCVAGGADDCDFLQTVFGDGVDQNAADAPSPSGGGTSSGSTSGTSGETDAGAPTRTSTGTTDTSDAGTVTATTAPSFTAAVAKQNATMCAKELDAFDQCVTEAEGASAGMGGTGGSDPSTTGTSTGIEQDGGSGGGTVCDSSNVTAFDDAVKRVSTAADQVRTGCSSSCTVQMDNYGGCYMVADTASFSDVTTAITDATVAYLALSTAEQACVSLPTGAGQDVCGGVTVECVQGTCQVASGGLIGLPDGGAIFQDGGADSDGGAGIAEDGGTDSGTVAQDGGTDGATVAQDGGADGGL